MEKDDDCQALYTAYDHQDFDEFQHILRSTTENTKFVVYHLVRVYENSKREFLQELLRHPYTVLDGKDILNFLRYYKKIDKDILEALFDHIKTKDRILVEDLLNATSSRDNPEMISEALRILLKDNTVSPGFLSCMLGTCLTCHVRCQRGRDKENPIVFIKAFIDGGVDISSFHDVLPRYLHSSRKVHPGVTEELIRHGIPKSAAYVATYMKCARYRHRLTML